MLSCCRLRSCLTVLLAYSSWAQAAAAGEAAADVVAIWNSQQSDVASVAVDGWLYRVFMIGASEPLDVKQVESQFRSNGIPRDAASLKAFGVYLQERYGIKAGEPQRLRLRIDGQKKLEDSYTLQVVDGDTKLETADAGRQASIYKPDSDRMHLIGVSDIRFVPMLPIGYTFPSIEKRGDHRAILSTLPMGAGRIVSTYDVDLDTGLLFEMHRTAGDGIRMQDIFQYDFTVDSSGVAIPQAKLLIDYASGKPQLVEIIIVEKASFNVPLDPSEFSVPAEPGLILFDHRHKTNGYPAVYQLRTATRDLVGFANDQAQYVK